MTILDLFCGEGGAAAGYAAAGFTVIGVDIEPQPNYPFEFIRADALVLVEAMLAVQDAKWFQRTWLATFDAVHASPPCQFASVYGNNKEHVRDDHPNLIPATRELLRASGLPYVIENVEGARDHLIDPVKICGTGLDWCRVRRHRYFETNWGLQGAECNHSRYFIRFFPGSTNRPQGRTVMNVGEYRVPLRLQRKVMKMPWASLHGISQAVPPAYTEHIGTQLMAYLTQEMAA